MSNKQMQMFTQPKKAIVSVPESHELVVMEKVIDWDSLIGIAMVERRRRVKAITGPEPHYRELLGAVALMA